VALAAVALARPRVAPPARHVRAPVPPAVEGPCGSAQQALALALAQARAALALARVALAAAALARPRVALAAAAVAQAQVALALAQALAPASSQRSTRSGRADNSSSVRGDSTSCVSATACRRGEGNGLAMALETK